MGQIVNIVCPRDIFSVRGSGYVMCNEQTDKYFFISYYIAYAQIFYAFGHGKVWRTSNDFCYASNDGIEKFGMVSKYKKPLICFGNKGWLKITILTSAHQKLFQGLQTFPKPCTMPEYNLPVTWNY